MACCHHDGALNVLIICLCLLFSSIGRVGAEFDGIGHLVLAGLFAAGFLAKDG
jgi:hypothetical protein